MNTNSSVTRSQYCYWAWGWGPGLAPKTRRAIRNTSLKIRKLDKIGKKKSAAAPPSKLLRFRLHDRRTLIPPQNLGAGDEFAPHI